MISLSLIYLLQSSAVTLRRDKSILFTRIVIVLLLYSFMIALSSLHFAAIDRGIGLYGGLFHSTSNTQVFHMFIFVLSAIIMQLTAFYPLKTWTAKYSALFRLLFNKYIPHKKRAASEIEQQFKIIEYPLILLFIIAGAVLLTSTSDLVSVFLSIELQSYGLYLLCTIYRNSELATKAGLTYFLLGGLSSCFILLGSSLLYANSGTTNLDGLYIVTSISDSNDNNILFLSKSYYLNFSLLIMSVGFLFKISAAPFHFWSPDVYDAIPTIVTTFVAIISKISIFLFLLELLHYTTSIFFSFEFTWTYSLLVSSLLSLIVGGVLGLTQFRIKRLFAYSTISHVGFILLALTINSVESIQAFIFYLIQYSITNLNAFILLLAIGFSLSHFDNSKYKHILDKDNSPIQLIGQLKGYFYINPLLALSLAITIFSFAGVPPLIGFFAKQMVLSSAIDSGYIFLTFTAILTSVISAVYYLNIVRQMFFHNHDYIAKQEHCGKLNYCIATDTFIVEKNSLNHKNTILSSYLTITISNLTLMISLFIFTPQVLLSLANILALIRFNC